MATVLARTSAPRREWARPEPAAKPGVRILGQRHGGLHLMHHRLMLLMLLIAGVTAIIGLRILYLAAFGDHAGRKTVITSFLPERGDIVDRNGAMLARTIDAWTISVHPQKVIGDKLVLAERLAAVMPEKDAAEYHRILTSGRKFVFLQRRALPETVAAVNAIGEPGISFEREPERLYPQTKLASHVLGWTDLDGRGAAGMERVLDARLTDPGSRGVPQVLSIDSRVQAAVEGELGRAMERFNAVGATGVVLDVHTGELLALASLPSYNGNAAGRAPADWRFNRATMGVYELGSTFKPLTVAAAMEAGVVRSMSRVYDSSPVQVGRYRINDDHPLGRGMNVPEMLIHSSNTVTARIADEMGEARMSAAFRNMGFGAPAQLELPEKGKPIWPRYWARTTLMNIGFGHGMAVTPLHLANAYAAMVNGGVLRPATLYKREGDQIPAGARVFSEATSARMRQLLRLIVLAGTGKKADAPGYRIGGKTGTADKPMNGGYARNARISTFASAFPMDDPRYVVVAMLDEPKGTAETFGFATAGWNAAPVVKEVVARIGPLLGVVPDRNREVPLGDLRYLTEKKDGEE